MQNTEIANARAKAVTNLSVMLTTYVGNEVDITDHVNEISIFESINSFYLSGEMTLIDNSAMSRIGFIGQEKVVISFERDDIEVEEEFIITDIFKSKQISEGVGTFSVSIYSPKKLISARQSFSRYYTGLNTEIVSKIHKDFFKEELTEVTTGGSSHNVVFPFVKPYQAISMILKNSFASDRTPLFLFDTLHDNETKLMSMKAMLEQEPFTTLKQRNQVNKDVETGQGERLSEEFRGTMFNVQVDNAFDTLKLLSSGAIANTGNKVDISTKSIEKFEFDYTKHGQPVGNDFLSDKYELDNRKLTDYRRPNSEVFYQNSLGFDSLSNLNTKDPFGIMAANGYAKRFRTSALSCYVDSIGGLGCGKTVDVEMKILAPALSEAQDMNDYVHSGKYLVSAVRHFIKRKEYRMSLELIRDGIGEEVEL
jgi:hypothetical protein